MIPQQAMMKDALTEARCSNELLEHLEHLHKTNDLFGNVAKSQNLNLVVRSNLVGSQPSGKGPADWFTGGIPPGTRGMGAACRSAMAETPSTSMRSRW